MAASRVAVAVCKRGHTLKRVRTVRTKIDNNMHIGRTASWGGAVGMDRGGGAPTDGTHLRERDVLSWGR